jgi:hypothetical protein
VIALAQFALVSHLEGGTPPDVPTLQKQLSGFPVSLGAWTRPARPATTLPSADPLTRRLVAAYGKTPDDFFSHPYVLRDGPQAGLGCKLFMVHTRDGSDRSHHPLICFQVAGYQAEDPAGVPVAIPGHQTPVRRFGFPGDGPKQYVFYWHYTFELPEPPGQTFLQRMHQRFTRRAPSLTLQVFTSARTEAQLKQAEDFVRRVDRRIQEYLPPGATMGSDTRPVRYVGPPVPQR